ncbi:hypothetical protein PY093_07140 [Cytobacillus sp. S13-E01]|uniref:hypothetical protein n=1 Tax=Cytobacillus sp. S13-E01 TaxID=3031326 RepID=UPI0023D875BE|nr:hypothetical protein [Cytobacillus sp. S13-E01]MDF0726489.1 hypothetical protein [Cytobacillus sp. S13-E01]
MKKDYIPTITEGHYPDNAGWTEDDLGNVLLLSIPSISDFFHEDMLTYDYAWLYNKELDAYIFCFKVSNGKEFGVIFQARHAGRLLLDQQAYEAFTITITDQSFEDITEESEYLTFSNITLSRQTIAGW